MSLFLLHAIHSLYACISVSSIFIIIHAHVLVFCSVSFLSLPVLMPKLSGRGGEEESMPWPFGMHCLSLIALLCFSFLYFICSSICICICLISWEGGRGGGGWRQDHGPGRQSLYCHLRWGFPKGKAGLTLGACPQWTDILGPPPLQGTQATITCLCLMIIPWGGILPCALPCLLLAPGRREEAHSVSEAGTSSHHPAYLPPYLISLCMPSLFLPMKGKALCLALLPIHEKHMEEKQGEAVSLLERRRNWGRVVGGTGTVTPSLLYLLFSNRNSGSGMSLLSSSLSIFLYIYLSIIYR